MQLIGEPVQHKIFGRGVVTGCRDNSVTVEFSDDVRKSFLYPDAFRQDFLHMVNSTGKQELRRDLDRRAKARTAHYEELEKQMEKESLLTNLKISPCSQAVFDVTEAPDPFADWTLSTGVYCSGYSAGLPRIPDRLKPNSMCLITGRPGGCPENQRQILGAFMVQEDFIGSSCQDGRITAHPVYRLRLDRPLPYWPYVSEQPEKKRWGRAAFRYLNNKLGEEILYDMRARTAGSPQEQAAADFYEYYCRRNRLPSRV